MDQAWQQTLPTPEDMAFWHEAQKRRFARIDHLIQLFERPLWTRKANLPVPRYERLRTNGDWSDWMWDLEEGCCDIIRACRVSDENNPHTPDKRVRQVPPSALLAVAN